MIPIGTKARLERSLNSPLIIPAINPKQDRVIYMNYARINKLNHLYSILYRDIVKGFSGRVILGPKDFVQYIPQLDITYCSQVELDLAWANRVDSIPEAQAEDRPITYTEKGMQAAQDYKLQQEIKKMDKTAEDAFASLGFGKKEETK